MPTDSVRLIGIDCAADPRNVGFALGELDGRKPRLLAASSGRLEPAIGTTIAAWIGEHRPVLLALDAPLGWPAALGTALAGHAAGDFLAVEPNRLFRRYTDEAVKRALGRQPLDVGAERIARTAHAALALLEELRTVLDAPIPLAWRPALDDTVSAIEVYPAGTLTALGLPASSYKKPGQRARRRALLRSLGRQMAVPAKLAGTLMADANVLDAALCVLAGADFVRGAALAPRHPARARKEGWIWVRAPRARR